MLLCSINSKASHPQDNWSVFERLIYKNYFRYEDTVSNRKMLNEGSCRKFYLVGTFGKSK